jgi:hypothetical protein
MTKKENDMKRLLLTTLLLVGTITAGVAVTQAWAHGGTAPIYRTTDHACATGATDTTDQVGHFTVDERGATLFGTVQLNGVASHSTFTITLVQNHPCSTMVVGTLSTDSHGNGTMTFHAPAAPRATVAWVLTSRDNHQLASITIPFS